MADFLTALAYTLKHEGGWSNDPDDPGGATNHGITLKTAQRHGIMTKAALREITQQQVAMIYRTDYWRFDGLDDQRVATKIFDMGVNIGLKKAIEYLQTVLVWTGTENLAIDGLPGALTIAAANATNPQTLLDQLCIKQEKHYLSIVERRPASKKFLKGWLRRAKEIPA
jgi:type VI secretion system secreted protein VgrG